MVEYCRVGHHHVGLHVGHIDFMYLFIFSHHWVANANAVTGGIWALEILHCNVDKTLSSLLGWHTSEICVPSQSILGISGLNLVPIQIPILS